MTHNYYLLTSLPMLGQLGDQPPISCAELLELFKNFEPGSTPHALAETLLLSDDLLQRDAALAGEIDEPDPAVLSKEQVRGEAPLPDYLEAAQGDSTTAAGPKIASDALWEAYFRHAADVASETRSGFLTDWVAWEVGLRNALVEARARELDLEPGDYLVAEDLAATADYASITRQWAQAPNPLEGQRTLDAARWEWLNTNDRYFSFGDDELAAYAARLMLAGRWHRLQQEIDKNSSQ